LVQAQISVFVHSTEISSGIIRTECHMNIIHTFESVKPISNGNLSKLFRVGNLCLPVKVDFPKKSTRATSYTSCKPTRDFHYFFHLNPLNSFQSIGRVKIGLHTSLHLLTTKPSSVHSLFIQLIITYSMEQSPS
jgi:hypothetical protein